VAGVWHFEQIGEIIYERINHKERLTGVKKAGPETVSGTRFEGLRY
jgi:hypothetical protein